MSGKILIIDDEQPIRISLRGILEDEGYKVDEAGSGEEGLELLASAMPDLVFLDIWMPGLDGMAVLEQIHQNYPELPVVMISGHGTIETAVTAIRLGAYDFIEKPLSLDRVLMVVSRGLELLNLKRHNQVLAASLPEEHEFIGASAPMQSFKDTLHRVAASNAWVLLTGENGTGKELAAQALHRGSLRADLPLVAVNCAAIPEELIESELFGHEKGAFTGASETRIGRFEMAHSGTLFLDEIGDMSLRTQARILRILQEQSFERVGGTRTIKVDVRVIAATNKDLEAAIAAGLFRADLYYRLRVVPLHLPPLRERNGDLELLVAAFLRLSKVSPLPIFSGEAMQAMAEYSWPGNVRELRNFVERMTILYGGRKVHVGDLPIEMRKNIQEKSPEAQIQPACAWPEFVDMDFKNARAAFEAYYLNQRLLKCGGNITRLAEQIGLDRTYLHRKIKQVHGE